MKLVGASPEQNRNSEEPREITRLKLHMEQGNEVIHGKRIFGDTIRESLIRDLAEAKKRNVDVSPLEDEAQGLIDVLLQAEIGNCKMMVSKFTANGDTTNAQLWQVEVDKRLLAYRNSRKQKEN